MRVLLACAASAMIFSAPAAFTVVITSPSAPGTTGQPVTFTASASGGSGGLTYQWDFGDGNFTAFDPANITVTHTYSAGSHYTIRVNVQDVLSNATFNTQLLTIYYPTTAVKPTNSSTIILDPATNRVWCVNADQDTVSAVDAGSNTLILEQPVGKNPRTLARAADGTIWVVSQQHPSISILDPMSGALLHVIPLPHGSLPYGLCMTPDGSAAYVSFQGSGGVSKIGTSSRGILATSSAPPTARGISVSADGHVFVTRFLSPQSSSLLAFDSAAFIAGNHGEVVELDASLNVVRTVNLANDPGIPGPDPEFGFGPPPDADAGRGVPNYLTSMVISPDGRRAWVPSKKDVLQRGTKTPERDGRTPTAQTTYRAIVSSLDLTSTTKTADELSERFDFDNGEMPQAACISSLGDLIFVALQGNNLVQVIDLYNTSNVINGVGQPTGLAPQGLVLDERNPAKKLYVHNYMGRSISVYDATAVLAANGAGTFLGAPTVVGVVTGGDAADALGLHPLNGKRVFYNAADPRMNTSQYISCAGCHLDGGSDMRVWDFTNRGEGFRNTIPLQGRGGMGMGNVHWSANFNEIQDFDNDVYFHFHDGNPAPPGPANSSFTTNPFAPLDPIRNNAGRSPDLDDLAAYVASLTKVSRSPFRNPDGSLTAQGAAGEATFKAKNCQKCHTGRNFTDSQVGTGAPAVDIFPPPPGQILLHNVGTLKPTSGSRLGGVLPGIDTPTLKGVWQTAPYFHDGSAATLLDVLASDNAAGSHFGLPALTAQEQADLAQYLLEIDEIDAPPVPKTQVDTISLGAIASGRPYSFAQAGVGSFPFVDRSYTIASLPAPLPGSVLLRTAEDDKKSSSAAQITFTLTSSADVYVFYDNRATSTPSWLDATWAASAAQNVTITPGQQMNAWKKSFTSGFPVTVTLGGNLQGGATGALRNYFAIVVQAGAVYEEGPLSQTEWVHDQDADGDGLRDEYEAVSSLSPWVVNTGGVGSIPDEDKLTPAGTTRFDDQTAFDAPAPPSGGGGGGGGCGFMGLEPFLLLALVALATRRTGYK